MIIIELSRASHGLATSRKLNLELHEHPLQNRQIHHNLNPKDT